MATVIEPTTFRKVPNLTDYARVAASFSWDDARRRMTGPGPAASVNIAHLAVDRHASGPRAGRVAIRWLGASGRSRDLTYADLARDSARFANVLGELGVAPGDRVFSLAGRVPELYAACLGTLKARGVFCPLFSAFGPEPVYHRLRRGGARVLVTTRRLHDQRVAPFAKDLPALEHVLLIDGDLPGRLAGAADTYEIGPTAPEDPALLHFTSGTTGLPKGALHVHGAAVTHWVTGELVLDLHDDDVFWCTADPGWVTGTSYGILAPLLHGVTSVVDEAEFDAGRWYRILEEQRVSVWYTAPTAIRRLMRLPTEPRREYDLSALRLVASVGEPLNPEAVVWGERALGLPILDNWWQTETGGIMIANFPALPVRPGSMGRALPGVTAAIVERTRDGRVHEVVGPDREGELALRPGWPSMFRGYLGDEERYRRCFADGWYLTGDRARRDADGYFWFVGRADDIIKTAGHMVGPFEVESALMEHPAVAEAGVIGRPEPVIGELVKAFVLLRPGHAGDERMRLELLGFARQRLGAAVAPKEIAFVETLPHTRSGKIMRRLLRARELGLAEGDTSTLEEER